MKNLKGLFFIVFCFYSLQAPAGGAVVDVERKHTNRPEFDGPEWSYRGVNIEVRFFCEHKDGVLGWPEVSCGEPYLEVGGGLDEFIKVGDVRLDSEGGYSREGSSMGRKIYKELVSRGDSVVYLEDSGWGAAYGTSMTVANIRLVDFNMHAEEYVSAVSRYHNDLNDEYRRSWIVYALSWVFGVPVAMLAAWKLMRWLAPFALRVNVSFSGFLSLICKRIFDLKVRRAAVDEAVRQVTRQRISESRGQEKEVFIRRIQEALENGDIDTAKALSSILEKDSRERKS